MTALKGLRVLVVEDEAAVAMLIESMLEDLGCVVVASATSVAEALARIADGGFEFALLDLNLGGDRVDPVAGALSDRGLPFAFASGYGPGGAPAGFEAVQVLAKPFRRRDLEVTLRQALG
ncbi:response regulator [Brevundimonas sp.]|uniref:response regulator n=1 Tax=Brevundimonas sp. TaxID=1871086 RepID=UPI002D505118|nr:response regulator [Brevundimonas sp.]HYC68829.1 response regulator [Brevundimonas sp.]